MIETLAKMVVNKIKDNYNKADSAGFCIISQPPLLYSLLIRFENFSLLACLYIQINVWEGVFDLKKKKKKDGNKTQKGHWVRHINALNDD